MICFQLWQFFNLIFVPNYINPTLNFVQLSAIKQYIHGILAAHSKEQVCSHCDALRYTASAKTDLGSTDPLSSYEFCVTALNQKRETGIFTAGNMFPPCVCATSLVKDSSRKSL